MPRERIPTTIGELLSAATQTVSNIAKHRQAMAEVANQAKVTVPAQPEAGGETK